MLSSLIPSHMYKNFLALHVAIKVLATPTASVSEVEYAGKVLKLFVESFITAYGKEHVSHNVHGLCHLASDVKHLGPLDTWSAFPFENFMSTLKRLLRKPGNPLEQLCNRLSERGNTLKVRNSDERESFKGEHDSGPLIAPCRGPQFKKVTLPKGIFLAADRRSSCCKLSDGSIIVVDNFAHYQSGAPCVIGRKYLQLGELYSMPYAHPRCWEFL